MAAWLLLALSAAAAPAVAEPKEPVVPPARDGNIAIQEELCAARKAGTVAAYDLFLARHPSHPLAETARRERAALVKAKH
ncbi:MAG: hypothetical protein ACK40O_03820 [Allosphingosinicella sp.]